MHRHAPKPLQVKDQFYKNLEARLLLDNGKYTLEVNTNYYYFFISLLYASMHVIEKLFQNATDFNRLGQANLLIGRTSHGTRLA